MSNIERERLTDATVKRLPRPETGNRIAYDSDVAGFGCRVTAAGSRAFILNYRTRTARERRHTIGRYPDWSTTAARAEAKRLRRLIDEGGDPLADIEAERAAPAMADLIERFETEHLVRKRPGTATDYRRMLNNHIRPALKHLKVADVTFEDVDRLHQRITKAGHPYRANRVIAVLSKMFALAIRWNMRDDNPCVGIERNVEHSRRRYLKDDELARLVRALATHADKQAADVVRLLLLTGCRRGEALAARWADLDLGKGVWSKPASSVKQNTPHEAPLSAPARQLLSEIRDAHAAKHPKRPLGEYVFPSHGADGHRVDIKRDWRQLTKAAGITGLRVHDLRHSFASQLASGGASLPLIGSLLGHSNPTTTHRYAHLFDDPQRAAVERVGAVIGAAGREKEAIQPPVELKPRGRRRDMAGKKGRSGRRKGSLSWSKNPTAVAGHHLQTLIEMWLAGVPIKVGPDQWLVQPIERKHTVPPKVKRVLAQFAIGHMLDVRPDLKRPGIAEVLAWTRRRAPANTLRQKRRSTVDGREDARRG